MDAFNTSTQSSYRRACSHPPGAASAARIGHRAAFVHAATIGQGVQEYEPRGKATREITSLYEWTCRHASPTAALNGV